MIPVLAAILLQLAPAPATPTPRQKCSAAEFHQMDFWVGDWDVEWSQKGGASGKGENHVVREADGCVIVEHFNDLTGGFKGVGMYSYVPFAKRWVQDWMDNGGLTLQAIGGPPSDRSAAMVLTLTRGEDPNRTYRFEFSHVQPNSLTWKFQSKAQGDQDWTDEGVSLYRRR